MARVRLQQLKIFVRQHPHLRRSASHPGQPQGWNIPPLWAERRRRKEPSPGASLRRRFASRSPGGRVVRGPSQREGTPGWSQRAAWQLFNLTADIAETADLAAKEPACVAELPALWDMWNAEQSEPLWK